MKLRKNQSLFLIPLYFMLFTSSLSATTYPITSKSYPIMHREIVGVFVFEQYSEELLLLTATIEKEHFVHALKKEGTCELKDMIRVCGNKYLLENFEVMINDQEVQLSQESLNIEKEAIILTYTIPIAKDNVKQIKISSDYMFEYNDHAMLKVIFELNGRTRNFRIKNTNRAITAKF